MAKKSTPRVFPRTKPEGDKNEIQIDQSKNVAGVPKIKVGDRLPGEFSRNDSTDVTYKAKLPEKKLMETLAQSPSVTQQKIAKVRGYTAPKKGGKK